MGESTVSIYIKHLIGGEILFKKLFFLILILFFIVSSLPLLPIDAKADTQVKFLTENMVTDSEDAYFDSWPKARFEDSTGKYITAGVGFSPYYSTTHTTYADFNIKDYQFTTFETELSLHKGENIGDRGKTEFIVYADSKKIYSKTFSNTTPPQNLKLPIPTGTKNISLYAVMSKGKQGNHLAIFGNARLTNSLKATSKVNQLALSDIGMISSDGLSTNEWRSYSDNKPFEMTDGHLISKGIGFAPYTTGYAPYDKETNTVSAKYKISDYSFTTLETPVSLDNKWKTGDLGKTEVIIYADNKKIFTKTFSNTTPVQNLKLSIPKGSDYLTFFAVQEKGAQGRHKVIFENPVLTNSNKATAADASISLHDLGLADGKDAYIGSWRWDSAFQMSDGNLIAKGFGLTPYYSLPTETFAKIYIADYSYPTLETKISLDNKLRSGDRGTSTVYVLMDNKVVYTKTFDNKTPTQNVIADIPSKTKYVTFKVKHSKPSLAHGVLFDDPLLTYRPQKPSVNPVNNFATSISGKAKANSTVTLKIGSKVYKTAKTSNNGTFKMNISKQKAGTSLSFTVTDSNGRVSAATSVKVSKATAPKIKAENVKIVNNKKKADTVTIKGLQKNDVIKVYNSKGTTIATSKKVTGTSITISINQLGSKSGKLSVSLLRPDMNISAKTSVSFTGEK